MRTVGELVEVTERAAQSQQDIQEDNLAELAGIERDLASIPTTVMGKADARMHMVRRVLMGVFEPTRNASDRELLLDADYEALPVDPRYHDLFEFATVDRDAESLERDMYASMPTRARKISEKDEQERFASLRQYEALIKECVAGSTPSTTTNLPAAAAGAGDVPASYLMTKLPENARVALELPEPPLSARDTNAKRRAVNLQSMPDVYRAIESDATDFAADFPFTAQPFNALEQMQAAFISHQSHLHARLQSDSTSGSIFASLALSLGAHKDALRLRSLLLNCMPTPKKLMYDVAVGAESLANSQRRASEAAQASGAPMQNPSYNSTQRGDGKLAAGTLPAIGSSEIVPAQTHSPAEVAAAAQRSLESDKRKQNALLETHLRFASQQALQVLAAGKPLPASVGGSAPPAADVDPEAIPDNLQRVENTLGAQTVDEDAVATELARVRPASVAEFNRLATKHMGAVQWAIVSGMPLDSALPADFYERIAAIDSRSDALTVTFQMRERMFERERQLLAKVRE